MQHQAVGTFQLFYDLSGGGGFLDSERLGLTARRYERQHHHVRITVHEHVFYEFLGTKTTQVGIFSATDSAGAACIWKPLQGPDHSGSLAHPFAAGIHVMTLDIKDEFLAVKAAGRAFGVYGGELFDFEKPASRPRGGVGGVKGKQGTGGTAGRHQEFTPR